MDTDKKIEDDEGMDFGGGGSGSNKFILSEAMLNKKHLNKCRDDVKRIKTIMSEMQQYVQNHQVIIDREMVNEEKLRITAELMEE